MAISRALVSLVRSDEERATLEQWILRGKAAQALALRARIVSSCARTPQQQRRSHARSYTVHVDDASTHKRELITDTA